MHTFRLHWPCGKSTDITGVDFPSAFKAAGYTDKEFAKLKYWETIA